MTAAMAVPAMAADYTFSSGGSGFGTPTSNEYNVRPDPMTANERRNKDAAFLPPPPGVFSGDIPTDPSSPHHNNLPQSGFVPVDQNLPPVGNEIHAPGQRDAGPNGPRGGDGGFLPTTSQTATLNTMPWLYENGSIGTIHVHKLNRTITIFPGVSDDSMRRGAGHFSFTSAWDGNAAMASHNRGASSHFSFVRDLQIGDKITYTTRYGTRTYEVFNKEQINEFDNSKLGWSAENILTLITCVENRPELRWAVVLREVR